MVAEGASSCAVADPPALRVCGVVPAALCVVLSNAAKQVTACDFMAVSIEANRQQHAALGNVDFLVADVTEMEQVGGWAQKLGTRCRQQCQ